VRKERKKRGVWKKGRIGGIGVLCYYVWTKAGGVAEGCWFAQRINGTARISVGVGAESESVLPRDTQIVTVHIAEIVGDDQQALCCEGGATACSAR